MKKKLKQLQGIRLSKRQEFVLITIILTVGLIATQLVSVNLRFHFVLFLTIATYLLSAWGLREELKGIEWITLLALPSLFTASVALFYFILPVRWLTRVPTALLYAIGIYATLLVENIYNVAVERSIQLLRVAHAVGLLITLVTLFLFLNTLFSFRLISYVNMLATFIIVFPLVLQAIWAIELDSRIGKRCFVYTVFVSLVLSEIAFVISFWPLRPILASLLITTSFYSLVGIIQQYFANRLFQKNIMEFIRVFVVVFLLLLLTTKYR